MTDSRHLVSNGIANVLQTIIGAGLLFALYRYINTNLGVEMLGVWSVVLASVSATRLADMGLSASVIRFVARDCARRDFDRAGQVVDTVAITLMVTISVALILAYPLLVIILPYLFQNNFLAQAEAILPYALVSLWMTIIAAVFQGGLDGCQRMSLRAGLVITSQAVQLVVSVWLVPQHGLVGLAWAHIGQGLYLMVVGRILLRYTVLVLPSFPRRWRWQVLREMLGYGVNVQSATLFMVAMDPVANALMARFGGPGAAGYFLMANQVVVKARTIIVAANQAIVPVVATLAEAEHCRLNNLYRENMRLVIVVTLPSFALLYAWAGGVSWLLTGGYQTEFVSSLGLLSLAWCINTISGPAYFMNMGAGSVGLNTISHAIIGTLNAVLGWILGSHFGADGVLFAHSFALIIGSGMLIVVFQHQNHVGLRTVLSLEHLSLLVACAIVVALGWSDLFRVLSSSLNTLSIVLISSPIILALAVWHHPLRKCILSRLLTRSEPP